jgi:hypothetical protein
MREKNFKVKMSGRLLVVMALHALKLAKDLEEQKESQEPLEVSGFDKPYHFQSVESSDMLINQLREFGIKPFDDAAIELLLKGEL